MNEFVKTTCACDIGYNKGVLKKTIENNIFTIFGNLNQKNSIVIRYHGLLTENNSTEFKLFYYFDTPENDKSYINLQKCHKCSGDCFCANIDLEHHTKIFFGFIDENSIYDDNQGKAFELEIAPDPITDIMQRYGFEPNTNLPTCTKSQDKLNKFKGIISSIQKLFKKLLMQ